jgi:hypothetical protein
MMSQIRNPNAEYRKKSEVQNPNQRADMILHVIIPNRSQIQFGIRASDFFRISDFGLRVFSVILQKHDNPPGIILAG